MKIDTLKIDLTTVEFFDDYIEEEENSSTYLNNILIELLEKYRD